MNLQYLKNKSTLSGQSIDRIISMLEEGATIPFIARYRKEATDGATDSQLRGFYDEYLHFKKVNSRRDDIIQTLKNREALTFELQGSLNSAVTLVELEDLYLPFKQKRRTRAQVAIEKGLRPLGERLIQGIDSQYDFTLFAEKFIGAHFNNTDDAIQGAMDIAAEYYADDHKEREFVRKQAFQFGQAEIKATKLCDPNGIFQQFDQYHSNINQIPAHRLLAIFRGVAEKQLSLKVTVDHERHKLAIQKMRLQAKSNISEWVLEAYYDGYKRLLYPAIEREVIQSLKEKAENSAILSFSKNLSQLLMSPPIQAKAILGVDPGFKSGTKLAVINSQGSYLDSAIIYPTAPHYKTNEANQIVQKLVNQYCVDTVAIGNGTASRELQDFFAQFNDVTQQTLRYTVVSEAGASVYSASKLAEEEYPSLDVTIRGAISIAQRLHNPIAAFVKIDPKSLGIGQYQHDVDQKKLTQKLHAVTESVVNNIGVNINTASYPLLSYVAGISEKLAKKIIEYRDKNGEFQSIQTLKKVTGLGAKTFEQCAGFIRIPNAKNILDNTGIHPEQYSAANTLLKQSKKEGFQHIDILTFSEQYSIGALTLKDMIVELKKPGFDPRETLPEILFSANAFDIETIQVGTIVSGVVRNITDFGVFVDIGLKNDGMVHISELSDQRVNHPSDVVGLNEQLHRLKVISVDLDRKRVGLSLK